MVRYLYLIFRDLMVESLHLGTATWEDFMQQGTVFYIKETGLLHNRIVIFIATELLMC